ncbi:phage major capsid protein [Limnobacter sp.]|uniref:phage major capsid protein n=1 Tax=Limnobacter sp. TaxID=2003368 RepID=UPI0025B9E678|nr:phage major capsid protein [Limnobacter sp.]
MSDKIKEAIEQIGTEFAEFKKTNDERLKQIAEKGHADPLLEAKLNKLNESIGQLESVKSRLDALEVARQRLATGVGDEKSAEKAEHKKAFMSFMKKGREDGLRELEQKAYQIGVGEDGGFAVPETIDTMIHDLIVDISPVRSVANVIQTGTSDYKKLVNKRGTGSGWVGEDDPRAETASSRLAEVPLFFGEIYAQPAATQQMLDDVFFDAESWISMEVATEFAQKEAAAFISGDGVKKPKGFLAYAQSADRDGVRAFGTLQALNSGNAANLGGFDRLIDVVHSLKAAHRTGAVWMGNRETFGSVRKLKTDDGHYLWQPSMVAGVPSTLLGYNVAEAEDMPIIGDGNVPLAFGNFKAGYMIADRVGVRVLRDPYSSKPFVLFYSTKRVGGAVVDSEAIKLLKTAA